MLEAGIALLGLHVNPGTCNVRARACIHQCPSKSFWQLGTMLFSLTSHSPYSEAPVAFIVEEFGNALVY